MNFKLLRIPSLRSSLGMFVAQNAILLGIFFTVPLYLQVVQGYDAFKTGVQMLPVSIAMLVTAMGAPGPAVVRPHDRPGRPGACCSSATVVLIATIEPQVNTTDVRGRDGGDRDRDGADRVSSSATWRSPR